MKFTGWFFVSAILLGIISGPAMASQLLVTVHTGEVYGLADGSKIEPTVLELQRPAYMGLILEEIEKMGYQLANRDILRGWYDYSSGYVSTRDYPVAALASFTLPGDQYIWCLYRRQYRSFYREFWDTRVYGPIYFLVYEKVKNTSWRESGIYERDEWVIL